MGIDRWAATPSSVRNDPEPGERNSGGSAASSWGRETAEPGQQPLQEMLTATKIDSNKFRSRKAGNETARRSAEPLSAGPR